MCVATLWLTDIVINQAFPLVRDLFGVSVIFFACAAFLFIQSVVIKRTLPKTKGMTLEEIVPLWNEEARAAAPVAGGGN